MNKDKKTIDSKKESSTKPFAKMIFKHQTERSISRGQENTDYTPVIIKRNDHSVRHPDDILELAISAGIEQHKRPAFSLFLS